MASRDRKDADKRIVMFIDQIIPRAKAELGLDIFITSIARFYNEQVALYAQGRQTLEEVNKLRKSAGMSLITINENKRKVTWTMTSKHLVNRADEYKWNDLSRAVDFGIKDSFGRYIGSEKADINKDNKSDYIQLGELGKRIIKELDLPIKWGGDFKTKKDYPHWELIT